MDSADRLRLKQWIINWS